MYAAFSSIVASTSSPPGMNTRVRIHMLSVRRLPLSATTSRSIS